MTDGGWGGRGAGIFFNVTQTVLVATEDGNETTVVELADFVKSMPSETAA